MTHYRNTCHHWCPLSFIKHKIIDTRQHRPK